MDYSNAVAIQYPVAARGRDSNLPVVGVLREIPVWRLNSDFSIALYPATTCSLSTTTQQHNWLYFTLDHRFPRAAELVWTARPKAEVMRRSSIVHSLTLIIDR